MKPPLCCSGPRRESCTIEKPAQDPSAVKFTPSAMRRAGSQSSGWFSATMLLITVVAPPGAPRLSAVGDPRSTYSPATPRASAAFNSLATWASRKRAPGTCRTGSAIHGASGPRVSAAPSRWTRPTSEAWRRTSTPTSGCTSAAGLAARSPRRSGAGVRAPATIVAATTATAVSTSVRQAACRASGLVRTRGRNQAPTA